MGPTRVLMQDPCPIGLTPATSYCGRFGFPELCIESLWATCKALRRSGKQATASVRPARYLEDQMNREQRHVLGSLVVFTIHHILYAIYSTLEYLHVPYSIYLLRLLYNYPRPPSRCPYFCYTPPQDPAVAQRLFEEKRPELEARLAPGA